MRSGRRKPSSNMGPIIGVALAAGLLLFAFVAWRIASRETPNVAAPPADGRPAIKPAETPRAAFPPVGIGMGPQDRFTWRGANRPRFDARGLRSDEAPPSLASRAARSRNLPSQKHKAG